VNPLLSNPCKPRLPFEAPSEFETRWGEPQRLRVPTKTRCCLFVGSMFQTVLGFALQLRRSTEIRSQISQVLSDTSRRVDLAACYRRPGVPLGRGRFVFVQLGRKQSQRRSAAGWAVGCGPWDAGRPRSGPGIYRVCV
jgi:hypothetical protein